MKCSIFVATLACVLSAALAFNDPKIEQVQSVLMSYVAENMGSIRMVRGSSSHLACYDTFIPLINDIAEEAKNNSKLCVTAADKLKETALAALNTSRYEIDSTVQDIQNELNTCTANTDNLGYVRCMLTFAEKNKQILDSIKSKTTAAIQAYDDAVRAVDANEQTCLNSAVEGAKIKSDNAFGSLKTCLSTPPASV